MEQLTEEKKQELLAHAKRIYPFGARVRSRLDNKIYTIDDKIYSFKVTSDGNVRCNITVYKSSDDLWSEVVEYPEEYTEPGPEDKVINSFPIY